MSKKLKRLVLIVAAAHIALAIIIGWASGDWMGGVMGTMLVYVFFTGFPMMFLASTDEDTD